MRSSLYYMAKSDSRLIRERDAALFQKIWTQILQYGPWRVPPAALAALLASANSDPNKLDLSSIAKPQSNKNLIQYYPAGDKILLVWLNEATGEVPILGLYAEWRKAIKNINSVLPASLRFQELENLPLSLAELQDITANRQRLPSSLNRPDYGRCLKNGKQIDLRKDFSDGGSPSHIFHFAVLSASMPKLPQTSSSTTPLDIRRELLEADQKRAHLQPLPESMLQDNTQGHWDLFWPEGKSAPEAAYEAVNIEPLEARDPARDIQSAAVAIDFGTSSTVVVLRERGRKKGRITPMRVGVADMSKAPQARHYENPTVLNFENIRQLETDWRAQAWRPGISWKDAQCSHEAKEELQGHIKSGMGGLKSWIRRKSSDPPLVLQDSQGENIEFSVPESVSDQDIERDFSTLPLNPIELYAYYLGLNLNNQQVNGGRIFTEYYMTFPVRFEKEIKQRILASFRRGLLRSLPPSLIYASDFDVARLKVRERANEAAAYAAAVLELLEKEAEPPAPEAPDMPELQALFDELMAKLPVLEAIDSDITKDVAVYYETSMRSKPGKFWRYFHSLADDFTANFSRALAIRPEYEEYKAMYEADPLLKDFYGRLSLAKDEALWGDITAFDQKYQFNDIKKIKSLPNNTDISKLYIKLKRANNYALYLLASYALLKEIWELAYPRAPRVEEPVTASGHGSLFGVFDFGGGTTDFAVGLYRLPTDAECEENSNWEKIIDVIDSSGDPVLGGEHLVHRLAYETVRKNKDKLLANGIIPFTEVLEAGPVPGSEQLFSDSVIARANTHKLMEKLRPIWEGGESLSDGGQISETFQTVAGKEVNVTLDLDEQELVNILKKRIRKGVQDYFGLVEQSIAKAGISPQALHVILAGNSCKSALVGQCFDEAIQDLKSGRHGNIPAKIIIHQPLLPDDEHPEKVTLKTGVAIGILKSLDSEPIGIIMRKKSGAEAPFTYTVGRNLRGLLDPKLKRDSPYDGEWQEFGPVPANGSLLYLYTQSTKGDSGKARRGEDCAENVLDFGEGHKGKMVVLKAKSPHSVSFALRDASGAISEEREIDLEEN